MNPKIELALALARLQGAQEILAKLARDGADVQTAGRRALLLAYIVDPSLIGTQRELARRMGGLSESRVSRMCKVLRRHLAHNSPVWLTCGQGR